MWVAWLKALLGVGGTRKLSSTFTKSAALDCITVSVVQYVPELSLVLLWENVQFLKYHQYQQPYVPCQRD